MADDRREWTLNEEQGDGHICVRLPLTGIVFCLDGDSVDDHYFSSLAEMAHFIVDALNAYEQKECICRHPDKSRDWKIVQHLQACPRYVAPLKELTTST